MGRLGVYEGVDAYDDSLTPPLDKGKVSADRKRLLEKVEAINRAWMNSMRDVRRAEAEFSIRLFSCKNSEAAFALCDEWHKKRQEILDNEKQKFDTSWAELLELLAHPGHKPRRGHAE